MYKKFKASIKVTKETQNVIKGIQTKYELEKVKVKDLTEKVDQIKRDFKKTEIMAKGHTQGKHHYHYHLLCIDYKEWKEKIVNIEKEYDHFK
jgi:hypothetical protein